MLGLGTHILADFYGCPFQKLDDLEYLRKLALTAVELSGATIVGNHFQKFEPQGVSGVVIIAESHLSFHTWPELEFISLDYYTCGERVKIDDAIDYFIKELKPMEVCREKHTRGNKIKQQPKILSIGANDHDHQSSFAIQRSR